MNDADDGQRVARNPVDQEMPPAAPASICASAMFKHAPETRVFCEQFDGFDHFAFIAFGLIDPPFSRGVEPDLAQIGKGPVANLYSERN